MNATWYNNIFFILYEFKTVIYNDVKIINNFYYGMMFFMRLEIVIYDGDDQNPNSLSPLVLNRNPNNQFGFRNMFFYKFSVR